jgi:N-terminal domain of galactosyltransferase/N-terminal region of glycosyl transferase group 7
MTGGRQVASGTSQPWLSVVVPYRDRPAHLDQFIRHVSAYFSHDKADRDIPYRVRVIEQEPGLPLNRGALKNIGFLLDESDGDYTCFHDVDFLPMWADYSWTDVPAPIVWYGAAERLIAPGLSGQTIKEDKQKFFGGGVLFPNRIFREINGYSNEYWGWGYEDEDLRTRLEAKGLKFERRLGVFLSLDHHSEGRSIEGAPTPINLANMAVFEELSRRSPEAWDGLSTIGFHILGRRPLEQPQRDRKADWEIVTVRLKMRPRATQIEALNKGRASTVVRR